MTYPLSRIFLHFFDPHFMGRPTGVPTAQQREEATLATRLALLCAEQVFLPAASYIENPVCRDVIDTYADIFADGSIQLVGGEDSFAAYADSKLLQYDTGTARHDAYQSAAQLGGSAPSFVSRQRNTTHDLHASWRTQGVRAEEIGADIPGLKVKPFARHWSEVSDALGHRAFIPEYVMPLLRVGTDQQVFNVLENRVRNVINGGYFTSFLQEYNAGVLTELVFLSGFDPDPATPRLSYQALRRALVIDGLLERVANASVTELRRLHEDSLVARAVMQCVRDSQPVLAAAQLSLPITDLQPDLDALLKVRSGTATAHIYAQRVQTLFESLFKYSLEPGMSEEPINEGRKRIDLVFPNIARKGAFGWVGVHYGAQAVIVECKNYGSDVSNPEFDQLAMRMSPSRGRFGILACRKLKNMPLAIDRCRDVHRHHGWLLVPLTDADLQQLVNGAVDPGITDLRETVLGQRMWEIAFR